MREVCVRGREEIKERRKSSKHLVYLITIYINHTIVCNPSPKEVRKDLYRNINVCVQHFSCVLVLERERRETGRDEREREGETMLSGECERDIYFMHYTREAYCVYMGRVNSCL